MQSFTRLPLGIPARVYRSTMPFSRRYDPEGKVYQAYQANQISTVIMLTSDTEAMEKSGRDLRSLYIEHGLDVVHLPIDDFGTPTVPQLQDAVEEASQHLEAGKSIAIHCHAGLGRTGMFSACLARKILGMTAEEATTWVRQNIPGAVETPEQGSMVKNFHP